MEEKETREKLDNITQTLQQLIEKTQLKAGLLKLEAQDAWQDLEKIFFRIQSRLKQNSDEAGLQAHLGMMEARADWDEFKKEFPEYVKNLDAGEKVDRARLQAHLAKMELEDRFTEQRKEWTEVYEKEIKPQLQKSMEEMEREMEIMATSMVD